MTPKSGRVIAWLTFLLGIAVSVAGNIGHAASDGMRPGEWAGAAFWPTALMLSVEILTRVRWQPERRWTVARFFGLLLVSIVAAVLSYLHLRSLMLFWGEHPFQATIGPAAVDGLMLIAATALLSISKERPEAAPVLAIVPPLTSETVPDSSVPPPAEPESSAKDREVTRVLALLEPKVETSRNVPPDAAENAAFQAWYNAPEGQKPSVRRLADLAGISPSKAHRLITDWKKLETVR